MKKKILSTLLAVAMFASVAVPAFAKDTSTQEGDPAKITMLEFRKDGKPLTSIDIKEDEEVQLLDYLMAWEDKDTLVLDKNQIVWEIRDTQSVFTMDSEGHIVATEPKGSATVIARDGEKEKVVAKLTVNAKPNNSDTYANSWKFSSANYDFVFDNPDGKQDSEGLELKIVSVPDGSILTDGNKGSIVSAVRTALADKITVGDGSSVAETEEVTRIALDLNNVNGKINIGIVPTSRETATKTTSTDYFSFELVGTKDKADLAMKALEDKTSENTLLFSFGSQNYALKVEKDTTDKAGNTLILTFSEKVEKLNPADVSKALGLHKDIKVTVTTVKVPKATATIALPAGMTINDILWDDYNSPDGDTSDSAIRFKIDKKYLDADTYEDLKEGQKLSITAVQEDFENKNGDPIKNVTAKTNLIVKKAINTTKVSVLPNKTIEVGETFKLGDTLGWGNSKANVLKGVRRWYEAPLSNATSVDDYAIVNDDGVVTGVKTGKNRIYVESNGGMTAYCTVTVVPKGTVDKIDDHNAVLKVKDVTVTVGGTQWIDMYNIDADSIVKWTSSDEAIAKIVGNSENKGAKVWGLKEGTATLTLTVDGDVAATLNVTVKGAATTPSKPDATGNAQTGDTLFSNLF